MAESDPRKRRSEAPPPDSRSFDSDDDPLLELARIVSEEGEYYGGRSEKTPARHVDPIDRNALAADLEAELMEELESSFAARPRPASARKPAPAPLPPTDDADDLLRSIEEQLGAFERASTARVAAVEAEPDEERPEAAEMEPDPTAEASAETEADQHGEEPQPEAPLPEMGRAASSEDRNEARTRRPQPSIEPRIRRNIPAAAASARAAETREERMRAREERAERMRAERERARAAEQQGARSRGVGEARGPAAANEEPRELGWQGRFSSDESVAASPGSAPGGRVANWDMLSQEDAARDDGAASFAPAGAGYRGDARTTFGDIDESEPAPTPPAPRDSDNESELADALDPGYADPSFAPRWEDRSDLDTITGSDEPRVAAVSAADASARLAARRSVERHRSGRGWLIAAALLGVVVIGGGVAAYMRSGEPAPVGEPPVIAATEGAVKVEAPAAAPTAEETVGEAVYGRVAGNAPPADEQIVGGAEEPREISRIVLPAPQTDAEQALERPVGDAAAGGATADAANADPLAVGAEEEAVGPRRVRTYVVRPDGTIAESSSQLAQAEPQATASPPAPPMQPIVPVPVPTTAIAGADTIAAESMQPAPPPDAAETETAPLVDAGEAETALLAPPEPPEAAPELPVAADPAPPPAIAPSAEGAESPAEPAAAAVAPVDPPDSPAAAEPAAATDDQPTPPAAAGGSFVQVSSQRTADQARSSYADMQRRFPSILGSLEPNIAQADLGEKGVFFRVRVGPWPRAEAIGVCESLQAAGGSCFVTQ